MNVASLFVSQAAVRPSAAALIAGRGATRQVLKYAALNEETARLAALFTADGLQPGDCALVLLPMSLQLYVTVIALLRVGTVPMMPDAATGRDGLVAACATVPPSALIAPPRLLWRGLVDSALRAIPMKYSTGRRVPGARWLGTLDDMAPLDAVADVEPDHPALITFTSGSTGTARAIVRSHGLLRAQHEAVAAVLRPQPGTAAMAALPVFVLANLAEGVASVLPDTDVRAPGEADPVPLHAQIAENRVTQLLASPALCERLTDGGARLDGLTAVFTGGGPVFPDILDRLALAAPGATLVAAYGSSEAEPIAHVAWPEVSDTDLWAMASGWGLLAGPPIPEAQVAVLPDRFGEPIGPYDPDAFAAEAVPAGEPGEILVAGPHVVAGYPGGAGDAEAKVRVGDQIWHRTGDAGWIDRRGRLWLLGRCPTQQEDGRPLYALAAETAARCRLGPRRVACLAHEGQRLLVIEGRDDPDTGALEESLGRLGIDALLQVDRIPTDRRHNSKIDYARLRTRLDRAWVLAELGSGP